MPPTAPDPLTIDGLGPLPAVRPATVAELGDVVRRCAVEGKAVYPVGGGTMLDYGRPPTKPGVAVSLTALDQVIDFPARDMTITVQAGITIARLREVTRAEGLELPIDVPEPERATLGGAIACNVSGPRRHGYGTFRDYVLGITVVTDRGEEAKAGGRVVKNVAGYDLMKLHTGALGTLGVITQVTLKLRPVPEERGMVVISCKDLDRLGPTLDRLHQSQTRPAAIDFALNPGVGSEGQARPTRKGFALFVYYDGNREAVTWQVEGVQQEFTGDEFDINTLPAYRLDDSIADSGYLPPARIRVRANLRPSGVADFCRQAAALPILDLRGQAGSGIVRCYFSNEESVAMSDVQRWLQQMQEVASGIDGNVVIERCPTEWKRSLPVWGRPPAALPLMNAVKRALDPHGLFNPGRFVTDI